MKQVSWGILGTARIATEHVIPAMQRGKRTRVAAIASRSAEKAGLTARKHHIPRAYGSYDDLLADRSIDAVYIPLPNHMHVPWTIRCLEAGKHVLCEKPIGLNAGEAERLAKTAAKYPDLKVMEAFMYRLHPQWQKTRQLVNDGAIGHLKTIQSFFSFYNDDPENIRNIQKTGGGAMLDIGCYCVSLSRFIFDAEPERILGIVDYDPVMHVDRMASGILDFGSGTSTFTCGIRLAPFQRVHITGTAGRIDIEIPFNMPADRPAGLVLQTAAGTGKIKIRPCNQYAVQADLFSGAILNHGPVPVPLDDAAANMKAVDAVIQSSKKTDWIKL